MGSVMHSFVDSSHRRLAVRLVLARVWCSTACAAIAGRDGVLKPPRSVVGGMPQKQCVGQALIYNGATIGLSLASPARGALLTSKNAARCTRGAL